eukprot:4627335-Amphidinium_carterae.1
MCIVSCGIVELSEEVADCDAIVTSTCPPCSGIASVRGGIVAALSVGASIGVGNVDDDCSAVVVVPSFAKSPLSAAVDCEPAIVHMQMKIVAMSDAMKDQGIVIVSCRGSMNTATF